MRNNNGQYTLRCDGGNDQEEGLIGAYTMKSVVVGTDENGKVTDAPVVIRDEAATDSDDGDIKLSSKKPVLAVRLFEIAIREKGEKNPTDGRTAVHKSNLNENTANMFARGVRCHVGTFGNTSPISNGHRMNEGALLFCGGDSQQVIPPTFWRN